MKGRYTVLLLVLVLISCKSQQALTAEGFVQVGLTTGECYFTLCQAEGDTIESAFILEAMPPKFEEVAFSKAEIENSKIENGQYRFQTKPRVTIVVIRKGSVHKYTHVENPIGYTFCLAEVAPTYLELSEAELKARNYKVAYHRLIEPSVLLKKYVNRKRPLKENQYYFEAGYWTSPQEAIDVNHRKVYPRMIQEKLIELGYDVELNGRFDEKTIEALIDFQQKHGLKEGILDRATRKKLGF